MDKQTFKAVGVLKISKDETYVILGGHSSMPEYIFQSMMNLNLPTFYVARRFFVETNEGNVLTGETLYVTPRWFSASGNYTIDWFGQEQDVEVTMA